MQILKRSISLFPFLFIFVFLTKAQSDTIAYTKILPLPVLFYSPETELGFGGVCNISWNKAPNTGQKPGKINLVATYTTLNQILLLSQFTVFSRENTWLHNGEVGYFIFNYDYYGIGNKTQETNLENYSTTFLRTEYSLARLINSKIYLGAGIKHDNYFDIKESEEATIINSSLGVAGGPVTQFNLSFERENRDYFYYPTKGNYFQINYSATFKNVLSDYEFTSLLAEFRSYYSLKPKFILAGQVGFNLQTGEAPFYWLSRLGGGRNLRGYQKGRFRDKHMYFMQAEGRYQLHPKWYLVAGVATGQVFNDFDGIGLNELKTTVNVGARFMFNTIDRITCRVDVGITKEGLGYYLTFAEAF